MLSCLLVSNVFSRHKLRCSPEAHSVEVKETHEEGAVTLTKWECVAAHKAPSLQETPAAHCQQLNLLSHKSLSGGLDVTKVRQDLFRRRG